MQGLEWVGEAEARIGVGNADEFVVFGDAFGAGEGTGFDLAGAKPDGEMSDSDIFGFAGTVRHNCLVAGLFGEQNGFNGFGKSADLVRLD